MRLYLYIVPVFYFSSRNAKFRLGLLLNIWPTYGMEDIDTGLVDRWFITKAFSLLSFEE